MYTQPQELYHHGVKGQKWGVRKMDEADANSYAKIKKIETKEREYNADYNKGKRSDAKFKRFLKNVRRVRRTILVGIAGPLGYIIP